MTTATNVGGTGYGSPYLDSLILGWAWSGGPLLYYFDSSGPHGTWNASEKQAFTQALNLYSSFSNLQFAVTNSKSQANFVWQLWTNKQIGSGVLGQHEYPIPHGSGNLTIEGDFNYQDSTWQDLQQGSSGFVTIIHELGHGLGLEHPHDGEQTFPGVSGPWDTGDFGLNQGIWTTMTYNDGWDQRPSPSDSYGLQGTPMAFDVAALQILYGANMNTNTGDDVYQLVAANGPGTFWSCLWDAGGNDTISNAGSNIGCTIDLRTATLQANDRNAGGYVSADDGIIGGFTIAHNVLIENAIGGDGNDIITGSDAANDLQGGGGNDFIDGGKGADTMTGGDGDDTYIVDDANDVIVEQPGGGNDTVLSYVAYALPANVEGLILIGAGSIVGTPGDDKLTGDASANTLYGLGGADTMTGGGGDDTYYVDNAGDRVIEVAHGGTDTVHATISYMLGANVENLVLDGSNPINGTGNTLANTITGNDAANNLDGKTGADAMAGGDGDDTYFVDNIGDVVTENANQGTDTLNSSVSHTLEANVENLILTGKSINGTGNDLVNSITGTTGNNILDGGAGADTMSGLKGNDTYIVDNTGDTIVEGTNAGTDVVKASVSYTLSDNVENLILTGTDAIDGTGNGLINTITGNDGDNVLMGLGGTDKLYGGLGGDTLVGGLGKDTLTGGAGADIFQFDTLADKGDTIADFTSGLDKIEIAAAGFTGAVAGDVHLVANSKPVAADGNATFLFNTHNGALFWDDDGTGQHAPQLLVTLHNVHALAATDLVIA